MLPPHFVRFGSHNEQVHFKGDLANTYDGIAFNANLVAWSATGIAGFLCGSDLVQKPYFIDPLTHSFQHDISALTDDEGNVKKSVQSLVEDYGEPVVSTAGSRPIRREDFSDSTIREEFTSRVLDFQRETLHREAQEADTWDYLQFAYGEDLNLQPAVLVAPYLYMTEATFDYWIDVNVELAQRAAEYGDREEADIAVQIVLGRGVLDSEDISDQLVEKYTEEVSASDLMVWVDGFSEHDASKEDLRSFRNLCGRLADEGKDVYNLYGGYFSTLLTHDEVDALSGVCHGPQYGEDREVKPVGGGLPTAKYYLRPMHQRLRFAEAVQALRGDGFLTDGQGYLSEICGCDVCQSLVDEYGIGPGFGRFGETKPVVFQRQGSTVTMEYPVREAQELSTAHYMYSKDWELRRVERNSLADIRQELKDHADHYNELLGEGDASYLQTWAEVVE